jgi:hypothetical protein
MTDVSGTLEAIQEYVDLAIARRRQSISSDEKSRMLMLEEALRDLIDGAHPAPRSIEGHLTDDLKLDAPPARARQTPAPNARVEPAQSAKALDRLDSLAQKLDLSIKDKKKLNAISVDQLPKSSYTPRTGESILSVYYDDGFSSPVESEAKMTPTRVVSADGEPVELSQEARILFGLEKQPEPPPPPEPVRVQVPVTPTAGTRSSPGAPEIGAEPTGAFGRPTIVHLLAGGVRRGQIEDFDPASGVLNFVSESNGPPSTVPLNEVLAIFFGLSRGEQPAPATGQRVVVRLVNDRQVAGLTEDYQEGGDSLTVAPEQKRGNVDRIWIPAWSVKEIQLA